MKQFSLSMKRDSVKLPDHAVDVVSAGSRLAHLLHKAGFISGCVSRNRQMERPEEPVHHPEVPASGVDLVDEVLQTYDPMLTCRDTEHYYHVQNQAIKLMLKTDFFFFHVRCNWIPF